MDQIWARIVECLTEHSVRPAGHVDRKELRLAVQQPQEVWSALCKRSLYVEAAGGLVLMNQKMLWIQRYGYWDLPKGKAEPGESLAQTAVRECQEECGLQGLTLITPDQCYRTYHWYLFQGKPALKCTFWYPMYAPEEQNQNLIPQIEEGITSLEWIDRQRMYGEILPLTYPSIRVMIEEIYGPSEGLKADIPRATTAGTNGAGFPP